MSERVSRRRFLKQSAFAGVTILVGPGLARTYAQNGKLNAAMVAVGGRAGAHYGAARGENLVALCDADENRMAKAVKENPQAKAYTDYRRLFDAHKDLQVVFVSTPDHHHFGASMRAIDLGAGVYTEKPLTYSVWEARRLAEAARARKVATQMGNGGISGEAPRRLCEFVWAGAIGPVREAHVWTDRPAGWWPQGIDRPKRTDPVPPGLDWDAWLGPAPERPFAGNRTYHDFTWRGWQDFGTGALGDMGCHNIAATFWALRLAEAETVTVEAEHSGINTETYPNWSMVTWHFPARADMPPCKLVWRDGKKMPPRPEELEPNRKMGDNSTLLIGEKGKILDGRLIPEAAMQAYEQPPRTLPRSPKGHTGDFLAACRGESIVPTSHFDFAGPLTELVLLGNIALRVGEKFTYRIKEMKAVNCPKADALIKRLPRKGWEFGY